MSPQKREELFKFLEKEETICGVPYNVIANYIDQLLIEKQERIENLTETELTAEKGTYEIVVNKDSVINILKE